MIRCRVQTVWVIVDGLRIADAARRYPGAWSDETGETDAEIMTGDPVVFSGVIDAAVFAALSVDPAVTVLSNEVLAGG